MSGLGQITSHLRIYPQRVYWEVEQVRWAKYLSRFDIEWVYILGQRSTTGIADALNRMPCLSTYVTTRSQAQQVLDFGVDPNGEA